jgi:DNA repair protein RecO (recombination protein O)
MLHSTEGIVLKNFPYGEADLMVTFFTLDYGLLKAFAKSPRKLKSRFGSSLEPLTHSRISFWGKEDAPLPRLTQSDILRPYQGLREDLRCFLMLTGMVELVLGFMPEREVNRKVFSLLASTMEMMESDCGLRGSLLFKIRFLELKGYAPGLESCARCGAKSNRFYKSQGSVLCGPCAAGMDRGRSASPDGDAMELSRGALRLYESLFSWELERTSRIKAPEAMLSELSGLMDAHIEHTLSKRLKSREFTSAV